MTKSMLSVKRPDNPATKTIMRRRWLRPALLAFVVHSLFVGSSVAQQGPPPPLGPPTYRSDKISLGVGVLTGIVKTKVAETVTKANEMIHQQTNKVTVEALPLKVYSPMRVATLYTNRPNQYYVKLPIDIAIKVRIDFTSDRMIYIPLDLNLSCEGWETGKGKVQIVAKTGPPSIEGGNIIEDVIRVRDYINNQIKSNLTLPGAIAVSVPNPSCITIGPSPSQSVGDPFAFIAYDPPFRLSPIRDVAMAPTIEVTFQRLKRLRARGIGTILYQTTENVMLETYANFVLHQSAVVTMREDDEVALTLPPSVVKASGLDSLVIIANILQQPIGTPEDSAFNVSARTANFSPGAHTLQITKVYVEPPGPGHTKPLQIRVPAYELTYNVKYTNTGLVR
jgi:hypothetical protein